MKYIPAVSSTRLSNPRAKAPLVIIVQNPPGTPYNNGVTKQEWRKEWNLAFKGNDVTASANRIICDAMPIWLLPRIGNSCLSAGTLRELKEIDKSPDVVFKTCFENCSGKYLGKDSEGQDRWSGPVLIKSKLIPDKQSAVPQDPNSLFTPEGDKANGSTCELPVYTGGERKPAKTFWKVPSTGEMVPACTRGCHYSYNNGVCLHGVPFTDRCTDSCAECRKPYRARPTRKQRDFWIIPCRPPQQILSQEFPGVYQLWEQKLKTEQLAQLQPGRYELKATDRTPIYVGFDGEPICDSQKWTDVKRNQADGVRESKKTPDRELFDIDAGFHKMKPVFREVPEWAADFEFTMKLIEWIYPRIETQSEKRKFTRRLIDLYWVELKDVDLILDELKLSQNGFNQRMSRLKTKAFEFFKTRNS
jgi:hypothetical protein